ncbi:hypothetical protein HAX54_046523 [Datura stramonium]|uniref:Uncharacterized protein n=1 Tax=Datura stramonium TaxID=4076 RepID=A0ABS8WJ66_DATST|nr:hypothetical protein [Datura stramonium]
MSFPIPPLQPPAPTSPPFQNPNHGARLMALLTAPQSTVSMLPIQPTNSGASVDGRVYIWKISEGPDEEDKPQITGRIVIAIQVVDEGGSVHPREILLVGDGRRILKSDTTKVGKDELFSAEEPLRLFSVDKLVDGVPVVGTHDEEVTDLSMCQWMTTRLVSASMDGAVSSFALDVIMSFLTSKCKKNAMYAVHLEYGPNPAATRMDYMSIYSYNANFELHRTKDLLPHGEQIVQVYCVQTQAIQQYALDISLMLATSSGESGL